MHTLWTNRLIAANTAFANYNFTDTTVSETNGWTYTQSAQPEPITPELIEITRRIYLEPTDTPPTEDAQTIRATFVVQFAPNNPYPQHIYAITPTGDILGIPVYN